MCPPRMKICGSKKSVRQCQSVIKRLYKHTPMITFALLFCIPCFVLGSHPFPRIHQGRQVLDLGRRGPPHLCVGHFKRTTVERNQKPLQHHLLFGVQLRRCDARFVGPRCRD